MKVIGHCGSNDIDLIVAVDVRVEWRRPLRSLRLGTMCNRRGSQGASLRNQTSRIRHIKSTEIPLKEIVARGEFKKVAVDARR